MTVTIRPEQERLIARALETGAYGNAEEVIARALEALRLDDEWLEVNREAIDGKIARAWEQFERGEFFSAEGSRAEMERRKEEWLRKRTS